MQEQEELYEIERRARLEAEEALFESDVESKQVAQEAMGLRQKVATIERQLSARIARERGWTSLLKRGGSARGEWACAAWERIGMLSVWTLGGLVQRGLFAPCCLFVGE